MKRNFLTALITGSLILISHSHAALAASKDEQFLGLIRTVVEQASPDVQKVAQGYDDQSTITAGKGLCNSLDKAQGDPKVVIQQTLLSDPDFQKLSQAQQMAEGYYFGVVMAAAAHTYCPQHEDAIQKLGQN